MLSAKPKTGLKVPIPTSPAIIVCLGPTLAASHPAGSAETSVPAAKAPARIPASPSLRSRSDR